MYILYGHAVRWCSINRLIESIGVVKNVTNMRIGNTSFLQVAEFFDKCAIKPKANDFEYIDLTDKNAVNNSPNTDGFEELTLLERTVS